MLPDNFQFPQNSVRTRVLQQACLALAAAILAGSAYSQAIPGVATGPTAGSFQGSVTRGEASSQAIDLTLDDAMQRGLKNNLGILLSGTQTESARGQKLSQLQDLLPSIDFNATEAVMQTDLAAQGLRIPGFPTIIGPFGYTDLRASLSWSLLDLHAFDKYMAGKHNFAAAQLSADDARDMVVLTVGNAYLLVLADQSSLESVKAQVATAKVSLDQAVASHQAGTVPRIDELRARVDFQSLEQKQIVAENALEKDKLALARTIGLPLGQSFTLADKVPYVAFDAIDVQAAIHDAQTNRKDLAAMVEQAQVAQLQRKAATAERLPSVAVAADYGDIGVNVRHSHGTYDASGTLSVPVFKEFELRGDAQVAQSNLDTAQAQLSDKHAQVEADVRDALLDIEAAQKQVEVAHSSVDLANEALSEAQQRFANGVSDNLAVSQAQQALAQANDQYVASLYRHNVAKLALARSLGAAGDYKKFLGGK